MKEKMRSPFVIINTLLMAFVGVLILNANADRLHLPRPVKQAVAAVVAITSSGNADKLAVFAAVNQIGDSIIQDDGTNVGIGSAPQLGYKAYVNGKLGVLSGIDIGPAGAVGSAGGNVIAVNETANAQAAFGASFNGIWKLALVPRLGIGSYTNFAADGDTGIISNGANIVIGVWSANNGVKVTGGGLEVKGNLTYTGSIGQSSDIRLKKNIQLLTGALERLLNLQGKEFEWTEPEKHGNLTGIQRGFIAQEVEQIFPEWVSTGADGYKMLSVSGFEALTVEALRELKAENESLKARMQKLEDAMNARR